MKKHCFLQTNELLSYSTLLSHLYGLKAIFLQYVNIGTNEIEACASVEEMFCLGQDASVNTYGDSDPISVLRRKRGLSRVGTERAIHY